MGTYQSARTIVDRAVELLPGPPEHHDPVGYLAWEELVVDTGGRLYRALGADRDVLYRLLEDEYGTAPEARALRRLLLRLALQTPRRSASGRPAGTVKATRIPREVTRRVGAA
jgi:hypothetical protein